MENLTNRVYLLHERCSSPEGLVTALADTLKLEFPSYGFFKPFLPHANANISTEESLHWIERNLIPSIPPGTLLIGIGLGGLLAAKVQELHPTLNLQTFLINAPTSDETVELTQHLERCYSLFSSEAEIFQNSSSNWNRFTSQAYDVPFLRDESPRFTLALFIGMVMRGQNVEPELKTFCGIEPNQICEPKTRKAGNE